MQAANVMPHNIKIRLSHRFKGTCGTNLHTAQTALTVIVINTHINGRGLALVLTLHELKHHIGAGSIAKSAVNAPVLVEYRDITLTGAVKPVCDSTAENRINASKGCIIPSPRPFNFLILKIGIFSVIGYVVPYSIFIAVVYATEVSLQYFGIFFPRVSFTAALTASGSTSFFAAHKAPSITIFTLVLSSTAVPRASIT